MEDCVGCVEGRGDVLEDWKINERVRDILDQGSIMRQVLKWVKECESIIEYGWIEE